MSTTATTTNENAAKTIKMFVNRTHTAQHYKDVRSMITAKSFETLAQRSTKKLMETKSTLMGLLVAAIPHTMHLEEPREIDGVLYPVGTEITEIPVVYFEYTSKDRLDGKRWAYRDAIKKAVAEIDRIVAERNNVVSPLLAEEVQSDAAPVAATEPQPVGVGADDESDDESDDLPL